jgi:hypothetical protein
LPEEAGRPFFLFPVGLERAYFASLFRREGGMAPSKSVNLKTRFAPQNWNHRFQKQNGRLQKQNRP